MKKLFLSLLITLATVAGASAEDFFDTSKPNEVFNLGARIGINTSNRTINSSIVSRWNINSWGTGFDAGVVADINIRKFISIQPGFFYESRSGSYAYQNSPVEDITTYEYQLGKGREYLFNVPILASFHLYILDDLRWNLDFGPYFQFKLKSTFDEKFEYPRFNYLIYPKTTKCDVGMKMGMGLDICDKYYVGIHYLAGMLHAWNYSDLGGRNKEWMFTIGYNFK